MVFYCCPARTGWRFRRGGFTWFVWGTCPVSAVISRMGGGASMWRWFPVWCVAMIMINAWVTVTWSAPLRASVAWSRVASVWVIMIVTLVSVGMWLWPGAVMPVSVSVMVSRGGSSVMLCVRVMSFMMWRHAWQWYLDWAVCCYMTILIQNIFIWAMMCNVS